MMLPWLWPRVQVVYDVLDIQARSVRHAIYDGCKLDKTTLSYSAPHRIQALTSMTTNRKL